MSFNGWALTFRLPKQVGSDSDIKSLLRLEQPWSLMNISELGLGCGKPLPNSACKLPYLMVRLI